MAELITEEQPRIKFTAVREGGLQGAGGPSPSGRAVLADLAELMAELEASGVVPVLNDGLVAGNCAVAASLVQAGGTGDASGAAIRPGTAAAVLRAAGPTVAAAAAPPAATPAAVAPAASGAMYVSRSGKEPGVVMALDDFVLVTAFDEAAWCARYRSAGEAARPTSDTPLHMATLGCDVVAEYGWGEAPLVAVHGHALAEGTGLDLAQRLGLPISHEATLFSTPEDLQQLRALFAAHPYPQHRCYIRRGHGFFLLGRDVGEVRAAFRTLILPHLGGEGS